MTQTNRIRLVLTLVAAVAVVLLVKSKRPPDRPEAAAALPSQAAMTTNAAAVPTDGSAQVKALPRLVDLGAGKCAACKMMAPILDALKSEYADTFDVEFIDVWESPEAAETYGIRMIPTQIFYDGEGNELFRHEGFFGKEEILAKWKEHGVSPAEPPEELKNNGNSVHNTQPGG